MVFPDNVKESEEVIESTYLIIEASNKHCELRGIV